MDNVRTIQPAGGFGIEATVSDPTHLVVFVHGFNFKGETTVYYPYSYWGGVGNLIVDEDRLFGQSNFLFFGYSSSASLLPSYKSLLAMRPDCAVLEEVIASLVTAVSIQIERSQIKSVSFVAHSLGTHVLLHSIPKLIKRNLDVKFKSINLIAAPNKAHIAAKAHKFITRGQNPQTNLLGDDTALYTSLTSKIAEIRELSKSLGYSIPTNHIHSVHDPFVKHHPKVFFEKDETINRKHTWFSEISSTLDPEYQLLISWI